MNSVKTCAILAAAALGLAAAAKADPVKLRVGWVAAPGELPSIMEFKKDVAKHWDQSYSFEAVHFQGTPPMITALAANEIELAPLAYSTLGLAIINAKMDDLKIIADEFRDGVPGWRTNEFMVLKDGPIKTVADLKGKTLATNSIGAGIDVQMEYMLFKNHLTRPKDYTVIEAAFPNMNSLLLEKKADLTTEINPFALDPKLRDAARDLYTAADAVGGENRYDGVGRAWRFAAKERRGGGGFSRGLPAHHALVSRSRESPRDAQDRFRLHEAAAGGHRQIHLQS